MIHTGDRLSEVLQRDARMVDLIAAAAPQLRGLRNPVTRKVMGRLATIGQVARLAGIEPDLLVRRVNLALADEADGEPGEDAEHGDDGSAGAERESAAIPPHLAALPAERIVDLDVREDLRNGREPFSRIMSARSALVSGSVLRLRATFEPVPLYAVMGRQGFDHWTERLGDDDWRVWFHALGMNSEAAAPSAEDVARETGASGRAARDDEDDGVVVLDVRGLDPPEPMMRTLAALESLPLDATLVQINERVPEFLIPRLRELGFEHSVRQEQGGVVRLFIRRTHDAPAA